MADKKAKISLSTIVKNESRVILNMLNSVLPIIDYFVVVDTGSNDGTQEIIREFFKEKNVEGVVIDRPMDFFIAEEPRNLALEAAVGKADYNFIMDADDILVIDPSFDVDEFKTKMLDFNSIELLYTKGSETFNRISFISTDKPWKWYGPRHEILLCGGIYDGAKVEANNLVKGLSVIQTEDGMSWTTMTKQEKYEDHARALERYLSREQNAGHPRWTFYLACSYFDAGTEKNLKKALQWFEKRMDIGHGNQEELYVSQLKIARIKELMRYPMWDIADSFLKCGKLNMNRCEHLIPIIFYYHIMKEFDIAYIYSSYAMRFAEKGNNNFLFYEADIYNWKIYDLHNISCYWSDRREEAKDTFKKLWAQVEKGLVPDSEIPRLTDNKKYN